MWRFLYYPFDDQTGIDVIRAAEAHWQKVSNAKAKFRMYHCFHGTSGVDLWLPKISAADTLYIFGHCSPGESELQSWRHETDINVDALVTAVGAKGLPHTFGGKVKIFGCSSGLDYSWGVAALTWKSFAQQFADKMYAEGYTQCSFFGYTDSVRALYENIGGALHKGTKPGWFSSAKRAKSVKVELTPTNRVAPLQQIVIQ